MQYHRQRTVGSRSLSLLCSITGSVLWVAGHYLCYAVSQAAYCGWMKCEWNVVRHSSGIAQPCLLKYIHTALLHFREVNSITHTLPPVLEITHTIFPPSVVREGILPVVEGGGEGR